MPIKSLIIAGPAGQLEAIISTPARDQHQAIAIICHPHSLHGGTMQNKVVTTLAKTFDHLGLPTVRFNFRGVGKSEGHYAAGIGETDDLLAVAKWVAEHYPDYALWLAGFSFGSYVSARATPYLPVKQLVSIAPPIRGFEFEPWPQITCPWIVVQGDQDEVICAAEVYAWIETLDPKPTLIRMAGASHFFHGQLGELQNLLQTTLIP